MADLKLTRPNSAISDTEEAFYRKRRSFTAGFTITSRQEVLLWPTASGGNGQYYQWKGTLPKVVAAGSTPTTAGGVSSTAWVSVGTANYLPVINTNISALGTRVSALEQNPNGKSAYEVAVANGFTGTEAQWLASLKGATGSGLNLLGSKGSISDLPTTGNKAGDAYIVVGQLYAWDGVQWAQVAQVGPTGKSAYQSWLDLGNTGDEAAFIAAIKGAKGDAGPTGATGPKGDPSAVLSFQGTLSSSSNLPAASASNINQSYIINMEAWVSTGTAWVDIGKIQGNQGEKGDKGDKGDTGDTGAKGDKGDKGDQGATGEKGATGDTGPTGQGLIIKNTLASESQLPTTASTGDAYIINSNLYVWLTDATSFTNVGAFVGPQGVKGDKGDTGDQGEQGVPGSQWLVGSGAPATSLGSVNDYYIDQTTSQFYKKTDASTWTLQGTLGILDAPNVAGAYYLRTQNAWLRLNRYDLNVKSAVTTLDVSDCQVFTVDLTTDRTLNITNLLSGRSMSVIVIFAGNTGNVTWSNTINWTDGVLPTYFTNRTVVSLLWDGSVLIGFKAGGY